MPKLFTTNAFRMTSTWTFVQHVHSVASEGPVVTLGEYEAR